MTTLESCLDSFGRTVRVTGGRRGSIVGCYVAPAGRSGRRKSGGRRARWIYVRFDDGEHEYFKASQLRFVDNPVRPLASNPPAFNHFEWKDARGRRLPMIRDHWLDRDYH